MLDTRHAKTHVSTERVEVDIDDEQELQILCMHEAGYSDREIATELGEPLHIVQEVLARCGGED